MGERSFGAGWWRASLFGALSFGGCATVHESPPLWEESPLFDDNQEMDKQIDALALQREAGWDVGQPEAALAFAGSSQQDAAGGESWRAKMAELPATMAPTAPRLQPYYVPTLFQSLAGAAGQRLRAIMRPAHTPEMDADFSRGLALRQQFVAAGWPKDTALVIDAPGPRAVAVAAALADRFAPVFTFGNWPHPLGVVPAHQTIAATLFYLPLFEVAGGARPADAPPMFVLDANRLAPYRDADTEFDNRYFVHLPSAPELAALGVKHVFYVSADGTQELDDLNAALVELCRQGVDVKMVALGDFARADGDDAQAAAEEEQEFIADEPAYAAVLVGASWWSWPHYWYRGCWWDRAVFWNDYRGGGVLPPRVGRGPVVIGPPPGHRLPTHAAWVPAPRQTLFTPRAGVMNARPAGLGQVAVRASRFDGHVTGLRAGGNGGFHPVRSFGSVGNAGFHGSSFGHSSFGGGFRSGSIGRAGGMGFGG